LLVFQRPVAPEGRCHRPRPHIQRARSTLVGDYEKPTLTLRPNRDLDAEFLREELSKCPVAEVQDVPTTHAKQIVDYSHIQSANHLYRHRSNPLHILRETSYIVIIKEALLYA
jgi:hypothetical protein